MESQQQIDRSPVDKSTGQSLSELLEDLQGQCESLYAHYDHLTEDRHKKVPHQRQQEMASSSSTSSSDSDLDLGTDSDSDQEKGSENGKLGNEAHKTTQRLQRELEAAILEIAELKNKLAAHDQKAAIESLHRTVSGKLEDSDKIIKDLREKAERLNHEKSELMTHRDELIREKSEMQQQARQMSEDMSELRAQVARLTVESREREEQICVSEYQIPAEGLQEKLSTTDVHLTRTEDMPEHWVEMENVHETSSSNDAQFGKSEDVPEYRIQIEDLHEKLSNSDAHVTRLSEEKVNLAAKLKDREQEVETLNNQNDGLEERDVEISMLKGKVSELQKVVKERDDEIYMLHRKLEDTERQETYRCLSRLETENTTLKGNIKYQRRKIEELQEAVGHKMQQNEQLKHRVQEREADLEAAERKIEKLTEELGRFGDLKRQIEDLKIDLEAAEDEATTANEKNRTIELQLRLTSQKLRITEQLLNENEGGR